MRINYQVVKSARNYNKNQYAANYCVAFFINFYYVPDNVDFLDGLR